MNEPTHQVVMTGHTLSIIDLKTNQFVYTVPADNHCQTNIKEWLKDAGLGYDAYLPEHNYESFPWLRYQPSIDDLMITETYTDFNAGEVNVRCLTLPRYVQDPEDDYLEPVEVTDEMIGDIIARFKLGPHYGSQLGDYHRDMPEITKTRNFIIIETVITHHC